MAKCHPPQNDVGSFIFTHQFPSSHHYHRLRSILSLRKLISSITCCGCSSKPSKPTHFNKPGPEPEPEPGKLGDLLNLSPPFSGRREKVEEELREVVRLLQSEEERENGAKMVRALAKEDGDVRGVLGILGAIPLLVAMIDHHGDDHDECVVQVLYALLNLGIGNDLNKAATVQAGAVHKMLKKIESFNGSLNPTLSEPIVANFLALSALDTNKPIIGSSGAIPFLVTILEDPEKQYSSQARQDSLKALYNLSISPTNIPLILDTDLIQYLISKLGDPDLSERILSILSNVVSTSEGRKAISSVPDALSDLIDVLYWSDSPECQENASYVLMVMAHKSYRDRKSMIELGIGSALLELTLLGTTLAQKRASRILQSLRVDKGKQVSGVIVSAPIFGSSSSTADLNSDMDDKRMSEEKKAVKQLVQQSLQNNMNRIVQRANLPREFGPSEHLRSLITSSTSKSLPELVLSCQRTNSIKSLS